MLRRFAFLFSLLAFVPLFAGPLAVTLSGNFGTPQPGGSSVFDNQNYTVGFLIPDTASPSATTCCAAQISATYDVLAHLAVPGIDLSLDRVVQVNYNSQLPLGQWINIFTFTGLPVGDFMVLTPFQLTSGDLWNGLAGALGTPVINALDNATGTGIWHLEENTVNMGPIPIAVYSSGPMIMNAAPVGIPEPAPGLLVIAGALWLTLARARLR